MFGGYLIESYYFLNHFGALFVGILLMVSNLMVILGYHCFG